MSILSALLAKQAAPTPDMNWDSPSMNYADQIAGADPGYLGTGWDDQPSESQQLDAMEASGLGQSPEAFALDRAQGIPRQQAQTAQTGMEMPPEQYGDYLAQDWEPQAPTPDMQWDDQGPDYADQIAGADPGYLGEGWDAPTGPQGPDPFASAQGMEYTPGFDQSMGGPEFQNGMLPASQGPAPTRPPTAPGPAVQAVQRAQQPAQNFAPPPPPSPVQPVGAPQPQTTQQPPPRAIPVPQPGPAQQLQRAMPQQAPYQPPARPSYAVGNRRDGYQARPDFAPAPAPDSAAVRGYAAANEDSRRFQSGQGSDGWGQDIDARLGAARAADPAGTAAWQLRRSAGVQAALAKPPGKPQGYQGAVRTQSAARPRFGGRGRAF